MLQRRLISLTPLCPSDTIIIIIIIIVEKTQINDNRKVYLANTVNE